MWDDEGTAMRRRHALGLSVLAACSPAGQATISRGPIPPAPSSPGPDAAEPASPPVVTATAPPDRATLHVQEFSLPEPARPVTTWPEEDPDDPWGNDAYRERILACIRSYEQGADGYATDTDNGFYGAYQFDWSTWQSVGGSGNPAETSADEQDERAWQLYLRRGLQPWPTPAAMC